MMMNRDYGKASWTPTKKLEISFKFQPVFGLGVAMLISFKIFRPQGAILDLIICIIVGAGDYPRRLTILERPKLSQTQSTGLKVLSGNLAR